MSEAGSRIAEAEQGAVEPFGAVPAVAPMAGVPHCLKWVPIRGGRAEVCPGRSRRGLSGGDFPEGNGRASRSAAS
jgi:hypothetical protein